MKKNSFIIVGGHSRAESENICPMVQSWLPQFCLSFYTEEYTRKWMVLFTTSLSLHTSKI